MIVEQIKFKIPTETMSVHFEKVSQRKYFDIASVNFASTLDFSDEVIQSIHLAVGGVGPIPMYLHQTSAFLTGKKLTNETLQQSLPVLDKEITPISDARGSAAYKRLLARQLFIAQFLKTNTLDAPLDLQKIIAV